MDSTQVVIFLLWFHQVSLFASTGLARATCSPPSASELGDLAGHVKPVERTVKGSYETGDLYLLACPHDDGGFGFIPLYCVNGTAWSEPTRSCDSIPFNWGSIIGILVALANLTMAVTVIAYSKWRFDARAKIMEALAMAEENNWMPDDTSSQA